MMGLRTFRSLYHSPPLEPALQTTSPGITIQCFVPYRIILLVMPHVPRRHARVPWRWDITLSE